MGTNVQMPPTRESLLAEVERATTDPGWIGGPPSRTTIKMRLCDIQLRSNRYLPAPCSSVVQDECRRVWDLLDLDDSALHPDG